MTALDQVLSLRPANVIHRLGSASRLPVLNPADLLRAMGEGAALATLPSVATSTVAGLLRAAREENAVVGVSVAPTLERNLAARIAEPIFQLAEEGRHRLPFFLQAGPFEVSSPDARELAQVGRAIFDHVEAGFTLISVDASLLSAEEAPAAIAELLRPALERELAVELWAPVEPEAIAPWLDGLLRAGVRPTFARASSDAFGGGPDGPDFQKVGAWAAALRQDRVAPSIELRGRLFRRFASAWVAAGVQKLEAGEELAQGALSRLPEPMREEISAGARQVATWRLLGAAREALDALEAGQQERMEALIFGEALELFDACGASGDGKALVGRLAGLGPA
jgi:hypothetical protein